PVVERAALRPLQPGRQGAVMIGQLVLVEQLPDDEVVEAGVVEAVAALRLQDERLDGPDTLVEDLPLPSPRDGAQLAQRQRLAGSAEQEEDVAQQRAAGLAEAGGRPAEEALDAPG